MERESRVKKTLLNARVNLLFYFLTLLLSFFSRKIFLDCLGADFVGLTGTLQNILGYLNLAELGIGSAIGYLLYKPIFDQDHTKINEIITVMGFLYRWIGILIIAGGIIISFFLPAIFPGDQFPMKLIFFAYFTFLGSSLIGYFINYKQILLGADQKEYVVTAYYQSANIIKTIVQLLLAYYTRNLYLWVAIEFSFGIIYAFILNWKLKQTYPWLKTDLGQGRRLLKQYPEVLKKTGQLFLHKVAYMVTSQSYNVIIYAFTNLATVAIYGNYTMIISKVNIMVSNFLGGMGASIGNLVAEGNQGKTQSMFWRLSAMKTFVGGIFFYGIYTFSNPFLSVWLGQEYVLPVWILLPFFFKTYCDYTTLTLGTFLYAHGLFYDVWAPFVEAIICAAVSIGCGYLWGLFGVLLGSMTSNIIINLGWKSYFLFRKGLKLELRKFWLYLFKFMAIQAVVLLFIERFSDKVLTYSQENFFNLFVAMIAMVLLYSIMTGLLIYLTDRGFREFLKQLTNYLLKKNR